MYVKNKRLDAGQAQAVWPGEDERLRSAARVIQRAMGQGKPGPNPEKGRSRSPAQSGFGVSEALQGISYAVEGELADQPEPYDCSLGSSQRFRIG